MLASAKLLATTGRRSQSLTFFHPVICPDRDADLMRASHDGNTICPHRHLPIEGREPMFRTSHKWAPRCMVVALYIAPVAHAGQSGSTGADIPIDTLKQVYLVCERASLAGSLGTGEVMNCSIVYEELKRKAFGGSFQRLKAWSDSQLAAGGS